MKNLVESTDDKAEELFQSVEQNDQDANKESTEVQEKIRYSTVQNKEFHKVRFLIIQRKTLIPIIQENLPKLKYMGFQIAGAF